jgi:Tfp pilus assembly protein PilV
MPRPVERHGFSIVEVMMATTILLVGIIGLIQAITIMSEALDTARRQQIAQQIAAAEIEKLRGRDWTTVANLPASATIVVGPGGAITGDATDFALANFTTATSDDNLTLARLASGLTCSFTRTRLRPTAATAASVTFIKVVYTVSWTSNTGRAHRHTIETYVGLNGLQLSYQQA